MLFICGLNVFLIIDVSKVFLNDEIEDVQIMVTLNWIEYGHFLLLVQ